MKRNLVYHITSPESALSIVKCGIFYPISNMNLNNDNGLNCFSFRKGYWLGQCVERSGAKIVLEWTGDVKETHPNSYPPLDRNVLHDQHPWRCFIRAGSDSSKLRLVRIDFNKELLDEYICSQHRFPQWFPDRLKKIKIRKSKLIFFRSLRDRYRNSELNITIHDA